MSPTPEFETVSGGVTAATGFTAWAGACGLKPGAPQGKHDLAVVFSNEPAVGAATFTTNRVKAAPVRVSMSHAKAPQTRAVVLNSGNANACTGLPGLEAAKRTARATAAALKIPMREVLVCSTGRIGVLLPAEKIESALPGILNGAGERGGAAAARAIMTSDTVPKEVAVRLSLRGKPVTIGAMAKGAGMIDPNMATMLCVIATDANVSKELLQRALSDAVEHSFNRITVDGDMSTNDTVIALANGASGAPALARSSPDYARFTAALTHVCRQLAKMIVKDGEGVTKFVEVHVTGAASAGDARAAAEAIANSTLVKCAWFGGDPNWGRILDAVGYSGARIREELVDVFYDGVNAVSGGVASKTPASRILEVVRRERFTVHVNLHLGSGEYTVYTTDLSTEYVRLNMGE